MSDINTNAVNKSVIQLLQEINSGTIDPTGLDKSTRQRCIDFLDLEGYVHAHIAQIMKCSEKTVYRDIKEIKKNNELSPDISFAKSFVGDVVKKAINHHSSLVRMARAKELSASEKILAESAAWKILKELVEKLQSLGYLPSRPQEIVGDIFHHMGENNEESLAEIQKMVIELEIVAKEEGANAALTPEIENIKKRIEKAEIAVELTKLNEKQAQINQEEDKNV
ncbi:MAG TPA: hypothetical protein PLF03_07560 [Candidatus Omnitrophota bacterium]|nr:hypothetical protein [Candidatus Omnitrophota bacterium]